jgi:hypothetical protein
MDQLRAAEPRQGEEGKGYFHLSYRRETRRWISMGYLRAGKKASRNELLENRKQNEKKEVRDSLALAIARDSTQLGPRRGGRVSAASRYTTCTVFS